MRFVSPPMRLLLSVPFVRRNLLHWLRWLNPFTERDLLERYANFLEISYLKTQREVFELVRGYYPLDTRFVVLPMDMEFMGAGKVPKAYSAQLEELAELCRDPEYGENILPFVAVDPRRPNYMALLEKFVEQYNFRGIKLYPNLGYFPTDIRLAPMWAYANQQDLPIITHCSPGGIFQKFLPPPSERINPLTNALVLVTQPRQFARYYADPDLYLPILERYPNLRLCLAHFGGDEEWVRYYERPWLGVAGKSAAVDATRSWFSKIIDLFRSERFPNLYTDIAYTVFDVVENMPLLKVILNDEIIRKHVLFGSDFYMATREKFEERRVSILLRSFIEEDFFRQIACENPRRFLAE